MLLPHNRDRIDTLRAPTAAEPWRVLVSGCLAAWPCGVDGTDNGVGGALGALLSLPTIRVFAFCPEAHALGVPRTTPDIEGGDGADVLAGRARVVDEHGVELTGAMIAGGRAMVAVALAAEVELAILTDMSAACGSQVISDGSRLAPLRRYRKGIGVATALLLEAGIPVVSQRDHRTLALLWQRLDPAHVPSGEERDHHEHPWTVEHLPGPHPRTSSGGE